MVARRRGEKRRRQGEEVVLTLLLYIKLITQLNVVERVGAGEGRIGRSDTYSVAILNSYPS